MEQRRTWLQRRFNLSAGDNQPQTRTRTEFIPAVSQQPTQPATAFQPVVNQPQTRNRTEFRPAVSKPPTQSTTAFKPAVNQPRTRGGTGFQPADTADTGKFRQQIFEATPSQNSNNDLGKFDAIVNSIKSGSHNATAVLTLLQQRLGNNNGSWIKTFKSLQLLDYLLHMTDIAVFPWAKQNIDQIEGFVLIIADDYGRQRVADEFRIIKWLLQDHARILQETQAPVVYDQPFSWLARCWDRPMPPRQIQTGPSAQNNPKYGAKPPNAAPTPSQGSSQWDPAPSLSSLGRMERTQENFRATGLSFLSRANYEELYGIFHSAIGKGAATISKQRAYALLRTFLMEDSQINTVLSWCDVGQLGELFFPDFALACYLAIMVTASNKPLGANETGELKDEVSRKVIQFTGGRSRREFLARQKTQSSYEATTTQIHQVEPRAQYDSDEIAAPDDAITQQSARRGKEKRKNERPRPRDVSPSSSEESRTTQTAVQSQETATHSPGMKHSSGSTTFKPSTPSGSFKSNRSVISDLVRDSKLETVIGGNGAVVQHISYESNPRMRQRRMRREETWKRVRELGGGGFGCVWLEEQLDAGDGAGRLRAVKEISKIQPQDRRHHIDYTRELEAIAKFSHSKYVHCFVRSFGWYESEQTIFITMEYMEKGDLQGYLSRSFPEEEVKQIIFQLLEGLSFMHENAFAHRDLKPANILVSEPSPNWWVKIGDFGISKRAEEEATAFRTVVGTKGYLAPEVIGIYTTEDAMGGLPVGDDFSSPYTVAVDIWALGAIMFRLLNNKNVFDDPRQLARYVTAKQPFPVDAVLRGSVSHACMNFLELAMARSPTGRPSSSQALDHVWLSDLHDSTVPLGTFLETLSIAPGTQLQENISIPTNDTLPSAEWPSEFE